MAILRRDDNIQNAQGQALSGAAVYYLLQPANEATLTPLATVYADTTGTTTISNPQISDGLGHTAVYLDNSQPYTVVWVHPALGKIVYPDQNVPGNPGTPGAPGLPSTVPGPAGAVTATGTNGSFIVPGVLTSNAVESNSHITRLSAPAAGVVTQTQTSINYVVDGPSYNFGNQGGWRTTKGLELNMNVLGRGIQQLYSGGINSQAIGDRALLYAGMAHPCGVAAESDEGTTMITLKDQEEQYYAKGTVQSTSGYGDRTPVLNINQGQLFDGGYVLDTSKTTVTGRFTAASVLFPPTASTYGNLGLKQLQTTGSLPLTTAWGIIPRANYPSPPPASTTADIVTQIQVTVNLGQIAGVTQPFVLPASGQPATVLGYAGPHWYEQAPLIACGAVSNGTQVLTIGVRYPHDDGDSFVFQGGVVGMYLSFDAQNALGNLHGCSTRTTYPVFGSVDGSNLIYAWYFAGLRQADSLPHAGDDAGTTDGTANAAFTLYRGAELCTLNQNNTLKLEPNIISWVAGDSFEQPNHYAAGGNSIWLQYYRNTPTNASYGATGLNISLGGLGITGSFKPFIIGNGNDPAIYKSRGGNLTEVTPITIGGATLFSILVEECPSSQGAVIKVAEYHNPDNANVPVISMPYGPPIFWNPSLRGRMEMGELFVNTFEANTVQIDAGLTVRNGVPATMDGLVLNNLFCGGQVNSATFGVGPTGGPYTAGFTGTIPAGASITVQGGIITGHS